MIELFLFSWGSDVRRHTSSADPVSWSGETWAPATIQRGQVKLEAKMEASIVTVDLDVKSDVPSLFKTRAPRESVGVTIYRGDGSTFQSIFMGEIAKVSFGPKVANMTCAPRISIGRGRLPIGRFSVGCRWQVYSRACGLDLSAWEKPAPIDTQFPDQKMILVDEMVNYTASDLTGGFYISPSGERHIIIRAVDVPLGALQEIYFDEWPDELDGETTATLAPGCNHSLSRCKQFLNEYNYGGFPAIPPKN